jgi:hypothetical protein
MTPSNAADLEQAIGAKLEKPLAADSVRPKCAIRAALALLPRNNARFVSRLVYVLLPIVAFYPRQLNDPAHTEHV